jgi:GNAT superfamily N-acetyltransferase
VSGQAWEPTPLPLEHAELVLGLERLVYGESDVAERPFYEWLYRANPAGEGIIWYAATGSPEAPSAGHYAVVPMRVAVHGETVRGSLSLNTLTHPRYRRQGVFAELAERVFAECDRRGIAFTYGFPNPASFPGFVGRLRFAGIGRVPLLLAPLRPRDITPPGAGSAWRLILRAGAHLASALSALARRRAAPAPVPVTETSPQLAIWDRLWERLRGKYPVMVVRDRAYVAWRFGACPTRRYRLYLAERDGEPLGFAATRVGTVLGLRAGLVVDLVTAPGARGHAAGRSLVRAAVAEFAASEVPLAASLALRHTAEYACLRSAGFFRCPRALEPQPFPVILRRHGAAPVPATIGEWLLTMGDYDAV